MKDEELPPLWGEAGRSGADRTESEVAALSEEDSGQPEEADSSAAAEEAPPEEEPAP